MSSTHSHLLQVSRQEVEEGGDREENWNTRARLGAMARQEECGLVGKISYLHALYVSTVAQTTRITMVPPEISRSATSDERVV